MNGRGGIRTPEGNRQQVYSLPPLATWVLAPYLTESRRILYRPGRVRSTPLPHEIFLAPGPPKAFGSGEARKRATGRTRTVNLRFTKPLTTDPHAPASPEVSDRTGDRCATRALQAAETWRNLPAQTRAAIARLAPDVATDLDTAVQ